MARRPVPQDITQDPPGHLGILWDDGHRGRHAYRTLRERCPCAHCVDEWTGEGRLDPSKVPDDIHPREGMIALPQGPGLGLDLDPQALRRYAAG